MTFDPQTLEALTRFALAAMLVAIGLGIFVAKPSHDYVVRLLDAAHKRIDAIVGKFDNISDAVNVLADKVEKNTEAVNRNTAAIERLMQLSDERVRRRT